MITKLRIDRDCLDAELKDLTNWATVKTDGWTDAKRVRFEKFEGAIHKYFAGACVKDICLEFGISRQELHRAVRRCLKHHQDGRVWGWRGLTHYARQKQYVRTKAVIPHPRAKKGGDTGAFRQFLDQNPDIEEGIQKRFYREMGDEMVDEPRIPVTAILMWVIAACKRKGLTGRDYPLCTQSLGRTALWRYLNDLIASDTQRAADARFGKHAARRWRHTGHGPSTVKATRPYERIEFDGHRIDQSCILLIPHILGGYVKRHLERLWLLIIIDVFTRAILGYHISLNSEYNADDVLLCVKHALTPWTPKTITLSGLSYATGAGFPSGIENLNWVAFEEFSYDNAKANLAQKVLNKITRVAGASINPGPVEMPERRPIIERFNQTLEEAGYHRVPSTTGSGPNDPRRRDPKKAAEAFEITSDHVREIAELVITRYNATPHSGLGFKSPLDVMTAFAADENGLRNTIPEHRRNKLGLLDIEFTKTVRGNVAQGRRPYVDCEHARYRNDVLARNVDLIGTKLQLVMDPEDPRSVTAFLPNGAEFGVLTANNFWGITPHTLEMRKAIHLLKKNRLLFLSDNEDPIPTYMKYLAESANNKKNTQAYAKARDYLRRHESSKKTFLPRKVKSKQSLADPETPLVKRTITY
ncbi:MAG: putative transposase [Blastocatellia bacterium]|jgi:transposase InsO family protein|nr:putative transposase [Blastocatellia bacterium]